MRLVVLYWVACVVLVGSVLSKRPKWHELEGYTFKQYVADFGRGYIPGTSEWAMREEVFASKLNKIRLHNSQGHSWKKGVNMFTDMTNGEWKRYNRAFKSPHRPAPLSVHTAPATGVPTPLEVDYRTWTSPRVLTDVKHQGSCGSCWAHSVTESMESYYALLTGMLPVLSVQQITSCTPYGCAGCDGGDAVLGFMYLNSTYHGQTEEWAYPYMSFFFNERDPNATTPACQNVTAMFPNKTPYHWFADLNRVGCNGYGAVVPNSAAATLDALATIGPLSISVAAGNWQDYEAGVLQNNASNGESNEWYVDHDVQMVGYGHDAVLGLNYWIVRNSWSTLWGEQGYVRLDRPAVEPCSPDGTVCGTSGCLNDPHYPFVKENPPQPF